MSSLSVPSAVAFLPIGIAAHVRPEPVPLAIGNQTGAPGVPLYLPDPVNRVRGSDVEVTQFYVPGAVTFIGATAAATVADIELELVDGAEIFWQYQAQVQLSTTGLFSSGNYLLTGDLVNPIRIRPIDQPVMKATATFDAAGSASPSQPPAVSVGQRVASPGAGPTVAAGVLYYDILDDQ